MKKGEVAQQDQEPDRKPKPPEHPLERPLPPGILSMDQLKAKKLETIKNLYFEIAGEEERKSNFTAGCNDRIKALKQKLDELLNEPDDQFTWNFDEGTVRKTTPEERASLGKAPDEAAAAAGATIAAGTGAKPAIFWCGCQAKDGESQCPAHGLPDPGPGAGAPEAEPAGAAAG